MRLLRTAVLALGLVFSAPLIAQAPPTVAPVNQAAPNAATAPTGTTATITADAGKPAPPAELKPVADIGQPLPGGYMIQPQVTKNGQFAQWMHDWLLLPIITVISIFVLVLLFWVAFRYRAAANPVASKTSHNTFIEVLWTLLPVLILVAIAIPSIGLLAAQYKPVPKNAVTLKAIGNQWFWTYQYPDYGDFEIVANMLPDAQAKARGEPRLLAVDNRVVVPVGVPVRLLTTANDVIHSWAVPALWTKMDAVPGRINETSFTIEKVGLYYGQCSELCGARHAFMPIAIEAVPQADFNRWIESKGGKLPGSAPPPAAAAAPVPETNNAAAPANAAEPASEAAPANTTAPANAATKN